MAVETKYICDHCTFEIPSLDNMISITANNGSLVTISRSTSKACGDRLDFCDSKCLAGFVGVLPRMDEEEKS